MFPHPDMGKHIFAYRQDASGKIRCGWRASIALVLLIAGAMIFDFAAPTTNQGRHVADATAPLEEK